MKRSKKPMSLPMPLHLPCRKQPLDGFSLAAGQVQLFYALASLRSSHIPLSYMIGCSADLLDTKH
jgi:hypothetical protein